MKIHVDFQFIHSTFNWKSIQLLFVSVTLLFASNTYSQVDLYLFPGFGTSFSNGNLIQIQSSYDSYLLYLDQQIGAENYIADKNFNSNQIVFLPSFTLGASGEGVIAAFTYLPFRIKQERSALSASGYGRKFVWKEARNEFLLDVGYGSKKIDIYGSFGVNFNDYRMVSYQVYPDGTESLTNEYFFNGIYNQSDVGLSYGLGFRLKLIPYIAFDFRYLFATDKLIGEKNQIAEDNLTINDSSLGKNPLTSEFPSDFTQPFSFDNFIIPDFKRHSFQVSMHYYFRKK